MESLLRDTGSCGPFQAIFILTANFPKVLFPMFMLFMSFGNYNPGFRCLDNNTTDHDSFNTTTLDLTNDSLPSYATGNCDLYESCRNVEYNPEASTIVTEWDLSCDRLWISSAITSSQMVGVLVGAYFTGYLGDRFGRKVTIMSAVLANAILHLLTIFSTSWPFFATLQFVSGLCHSAYRFLPTVYSMEFVSPKWRVGVASLPFTSVGAIIFAVCAMFSKDWKRIQTVNAVISALCFVAMIWLPRSIRWLATHDKTTETFNAAKTIAKLNGKPTPQEETIDNLIQTFCNESRENKKYTFKHLFRKGVKLYTMIITVVYFTIGLTFYLISFGMKHLPGNLYTNLVIVYTVHLCGNGTSIFVGRLGRRKAFLLFFSVISLSLFSIVLTTFIAPDGFDNNGIIALALIARAFTGAAWYISTTVMNELFPTVIRGSITGWASLCMQTGASIAPFLVPKEKDVMYVSYIVMGIMNFLSCLFYFLIPETSGIKLQDTWADVAKSSEKKKASIKYEIDDGNVY